MAAAKKIAKPQDEALQKEKETSAPASAEKLLKKDAEKNDERPPWILIALVVFFNVIGKIGDAIGPAMVGSKPFQLLLINSSNTHCILTTTSISFWPWLIVTSLRRFCEDPLYFVIGWKYREKALELMSHYCPDMADGYNKAEDIFRNNLYVAVAVNPGATVCGLAGASRMPPWAFFSLNIGSTLAQLLVMRAVCSKFPDQLDYALEIVNTNMKIILAIMVGLTLWSLLPMLRTKKEEKEHTE